MRKLFYIFITCMLASCQIEDKNAPKPSENFIKYFGVVADQEAADLEPIWNADSSDVDGYVIFGTQEIEGGSKDYYVAITDPNGQLLSSNTFGFALPFEGIDTNNDGEPDIVEADESARRIRATPTGYVTLGTSNISSLVGRTTVGMMDRSVEILDLSFVTIAFLDPELNLTNLITVFGEVDIFNNIQLDLIGNDIIPLGNGDFLLVGAKESSTDLDFYAQRFSLDGGLSNAVWERTYGFVGGGLDDVFVKGFEDATTGNLELFGYSDDLGTEGEQGTNVTLIELNENGNVIGSNSNGIADDPPFVANDVLADVIEKPGGYMAIGTSTTNEISQAFFMDIDRNGIAVTKGVLESRFQLEGAGLQTNGRAGIQSITNDFVVVGNYPNFRTDTETKAGESMFARFDQAGVKREGIEMNFGLGDGNDSAEDIILLPDGKLVMLSTADFGGGVKMISLIKLNDTGELDR